MALRCQASLSFGWLAKSALVRPAKIGWEFPKAKSLSWCTMAFRPATLGAYCDHVGWRKVPKAWGMEAATRSWTTGTAGTAGTAGTCKDFSALPWADIGSSFRHFTSSINSSIICFVHFLLSFLCGHLPMPAMIAQNISEFSMAEASCASCQNAKSSVLLSLHIQRHDPQMIWLCTR